MLSGALLSSPLGLFMADRVELTGSFPYSGMAGLMAAVVHATISRFIFCDGNCPLA